MKPFARDLLIAAQTTRPDGVVGIRPRDPLPMFDSRTPDRSGSLAGESFASALENHPRYPALRRRRHRAVFELLDDLVADHLSTIAPHLRGLGFDDSGIKIYSAATLTAFRAALPPI